MLDFSRFALTASTVMVALAALAYLAVLTSRRAPVRAPRAAKSKVLVGAGAPVDAEEGGTTAATAKPAAGHGTLWYGARLVDVAFALLTAGIIARMIVVGHAPFSNQYEFAVSFAWGVLLAHEIFQYRFRIHALALLVLPIALGMMIYAATNNSEALPLLPALQNAWLLPLHVVTATVAYGAAAVAFGAAVLFLLHPRLEGRLRGLPSRDTLDEVAYRAVIFSYPLMTIMIILGAVWANIAWGRYWSWDPKETAALLTWLIYGGYLHARVMRDWRGGKAAWLLIIGFAAILFTFFGNLFFGGLHSYGSGK